MIGEQARNFGSGCSGESGFGQGGIGKTFAEKGWVESNHPNSANNLIDAAPLLSSFEWRAN